jgi:hypothetical protein
VRATKVAFAHFEMPAALPTTRITPFLGGFLQEALKAQQMNC